MNIGSGIMGIHRIYGILLRFIFVMKRSLDVASDMFYWPIIDVLALGLTGLYFAKLAESILLMQALVSGILFWIIIWRGQYEITIGLLNEIWDKNLTNIFVTPIKLGEWACGLLILSIIKAIISFSFASLLAFLLYKVRILNFGLTLIAFIPLLLMCGWWVSFFVISIIISLGTKVQSFAWTLVMILFPFSGVYYPLSVLPKWAQTVAACIPTSYIFEGMREVLSTGHVTKQKIFISLLLNIIYLTLSIFCFKRSFKKLFKRGVSSLQ